MSLHTLDDDSERPMDYETSLLPKVFPLYQYRYPSNEASHIKSKIKGRYKRHY